MLLAKPNIQRGDAVAHRAGAGFKSDWISAQCTHPKPLKSTKPTIWWSCGARNCLPWWYWAIINGRIHSRTPNGPNRISREHKILKPEDESCIVGDLRIWSPCRPTISRGDHSWLFLRTFQGHTDIMVRADSPKTLRIWFSSNDVWHPTSYEPTVPTHGEQRRMAESTARYVILLI